MTVRHEQRRCKLQHTALSIKEIGFSLGFEDPSYFVKFFKRMTGSMPGEFREQHP